LFSDISALSVPDEGLFQKRVVLTKFAIYLFFLLKTKTKNIPRLINNSVHLHCWIEEM